MKGPVPLLGFGTLWLRHGDFIPPLAYELPPAVGQGAAVDTGGMFYAGFDPTEVALRCVDAGEPSGAYGSGLNGLQVLRDCWDPTSGAFRVVILAEPGDAVQSLYSVGQILRDVHDIIRHALRVVINAPDANIGPRLSFAQIFRTIHSLSHHALRITEPIIASGDQGSGMDWKEVFRLSVDSTVNKLRVVG